MNTINPLQICEEQIIMDYEYIQCVKDILENSVFLQMENYSHHGDTTCLKHCVHVSYCSYLLAKRFGMDYKSTARAGLIHDLFLYDWHTHSKQTGKHFHGFTHPKAALDNACKYFSLNNLEKNMILRHMWPLTPIPPKYKEGFIIMLIDKYCSALEVFRKNKQIVPWLHLLLKMK